MSKARRPNSRRPGRNRTHRELIAAAVPLVAAEADVSLDVAQAALKQAVRILPAIASMTAGHADPRRDVGGTIVGGTPTGHGDALIDLTRAVLLDEIVSVVVDPVRMADPEDEAEPVYALKLAGRVNNTPDRARVLFITDSGGLADLIANCMGVAIRNGKLDAVEAALDIRLAEEAAEATTPPEGTPPA